MVDPVLKSLVVRRFRSIPAETVIFDNPTFLVGENGSGKSNLRDAIDFMAEAMSSPLQSVFQRRGGISVVRNRTPGRGYPPNLGLAAVLGPLNGEIEQARYGFEVAAAANYGFKVVREECIVYFHGGRKAWFDRGADAFRSNVGGLKPAIEPASLGLPIIGGEASFAPVLRTLAAMRSYSIEPSQLRRLQDRDGGTGLKADGSNAASVLQEIASQAPQDLTQIHELLAEIAPHTTKVEPVERGSKLGLEFTQEWGPQRMTFEASSMSDGTLRALGLLIAAYQHPAPTVLLIEEPEATIHAGAVGVVHDILRAASQKVQVVVTTHSPDLLDAKWIQDSNLRMVTWHEGATHVTPVSDASRRVLREHMLGAGELLRSNALSAPPLSSDMDGSRDALFLELTP